MMHVSLMVDADLLHPSHSIDDLQMIKMYGQGLARRKEIHEQQEHEDNTSYVV